MVAYKRVIVTTEGNLTNRASIRLVTAAISPKPTAIDEDGSKRPMSDMADNLKYRVILGPGAVYTILYIYT